MTDFFKKEEKEEKPVEEIKVEETKEPEKVKVGDKEYGQEELSRLVGLGELGMELETKWNTKLEKVYPEFTKATQERDTYRKKVEEFEASQVKEKAAKGEELSPEELKKQALTEAEGLGLVHSGNVNQFIANYLSARDLIDDTEAVIAQAEEDGKPKTTTEDLLAHMETTGIKSPEKAYKDKFETELDELKEKKLSSIKSNGMQTLDGSTAGSKEPEIPKFTNLDSLRDAMRSKFNT